MVDVVDAQVPTTLNASVNFRVTINAPAPSTTFLGRLIEIINALDIVEINSTYYLILNE